MYGAHGERRERDYKKPMHDSQTHGTLRLCGRAYIFDYVFADFEHFFPGDSWLVPVARYLNGISPIFIFFPNPMVSNLGNAMDTMPRRFSGRKSPEKYARFCAYSCCVRIIAVFVRARSFSWILNATWNAAIMMKATIKSPKPN